MEPTETYRLFGGLYLDNPTSSNSALLHRKLKRLEPYLRDLESRQASASLDGWNCQDAFNKAAQAEVACWETHGAKRNIEFLIPSDGPLDAPLACHLHNPNFNVADCYSSCGADPSSPSVNQILSAGFTPDKVLIYDHTFRRDPVDGIAAYPPDVLQIHENFTSELRRHMTAVVDVVWGSHVRERMKRTCRLEELPLWGHYDGISVFLEWETNSDKLKRFVVFVCHPEAMAYGESQTLGKKQDLHLEVATRLAKLRIRENFYESIYRPGEYKFLSGAARIQRNAFTKEAFAQLEGVASRAKPPSSTARQRRNRVPAHQREELRQYPGISTYFGKKDIEDLAQLDEEIDGMAALNQGLALDSACSDASATGEVHAGSTPSFHTNAEIETEFNGPKWLKVLASSLVAGDCPNTTPDDAMQLCYALANGEFDFSGTLTWEDIPHRLRLWLQEQDGLKVDGVPIASVGDLLRVHGMILKQPAIPEEALSVSIMKIFMQVVTRYYHLTACAARESSIEHLTVRGTTPVPLKCSRCHSRLLDDPFPRFKKTEKERYVAHHLKRGCGSESCQMNKGPGLAVPWDSRVPWAAPKALVLERHPMKADWADVLLRQGPSVADLPRVVDIICRVCKDPSSIQQDEEPRWTIETPPRYVIRKPRCKLCCRNDVTWCPVDANIRWLDPASISKMWKKKEEKNWELDDMIENPSDYFPKTKEERRAAGRKRTKRKIRYPILD